MRPGENSNICFHQNFVQDLLQWYSKNARSLPWRQNQNPYFVWISEIMLQQTRVDTVLRYFIRFIKRFPDIKTLAEAKEEEVLKLWEGLGYYSRARNMHKAAKKIMEDCSGVFPKTFDEIRALPGIGDYTAGAIASISFQIPVPAVDGNVLRIVARICGIDSCIDFPETKKSIKSALAAVYPTEHCGDFTQSLMELGAVVCVPNGMPKCEICPVSGYCFAYKENQILSFPIKKEKKARQMRDLTVFILSCAGKTAIRRREEKGLLAGMWEFPNFPGKINKQKILEQAGQWELTPFSSIEIFEDKHIFTHIEWHMRCCRIQCEKASEKFVWADQKELQDIYTLPTAFKKLLKS